jgi:hypothetical protein
LSMSWVITEFNIDIFDIKHENIFFY